MGDKAKLLIVRNKLYYLQIILALTYANQTILYLSAAFGYKIYCL